MANVSDLGNEAVPVQAPICIQVRAHTPDTQSVYEHVL